MKDLPTWSDLNKGVRKMTDKEFEYCEEMEKRKHDEKVRELEQAEADYDKMFWQKNETISNLQEQIEKMKCCENCKHSNTTCECYTICTIGHYDDCKSNTVLDSLDKKDYWEN